MSEKLITEEFLSSQVLSHYRCLQMINRALYGAERLCIVLKFTRMQTYYRKNEKTVVNCQYERISQSKQPYRLDALLFCSFPCHRYLCCATKIAEQSNTVVIIEILVILLSPVRCRSHIIPLECLCHFRDCFASHNSQKSLTENIGLILLSLRTKKGIESLHTKSLTS